MRIADFLHDAILRRWNHDGTDREWDTSPATPDERWTEPGGGPDHEPDTTSAPRVSGSWGRDHTTVELNAHGALNPEDCPECVRLAAHRLGYPTDLPIIIATDQSGETAVWNDNPQPGEPFLTITYAPPADKFDPQTARDIEVAALLREYAVRFEQIRTLVRGYDDYEEALTRYGWDIARSELIDNIRAVVG